MYLFLTVLVHKFLVCFFMSYVHHVSCLPDPLDPLHGSHIIGASAQWLWSSLTKCAIHLNLISCAAWETSVMFSSWCQHFLYGHKLQFAIFSILFSFVLLVLFLALGVCPCFSQYNNTGVCTSPVFQFEFRVYVIYLVE